jgi:hypothetical protein
MTMTKSNIRVDTTSTKSMIISILSISLNLAFYVGSIAAITATAIYSPTPVIIATAMVADIAIVFALVVTLVDVCRSFFSADSKK